MHSILEKTTMRPQRY